MNNKKTVSLSFFIAVIVGLLLSTLSAEREPMSGNDSLSKVGIPEKKEFTWDKGPETIDVSKYPAEQQTNYKAFAVKCSRCHTLARPINAPYALPEEWEAYVKKMQKKKRSGLDPGSAKKIIEFLKYDSSLRKKDLINKKLKEKEASKQTGG
jgi:hypothetical protein